MGVSLKEIGDLSIDQLFKQVAESLSKIEDPITRNAKAVEIFGRAAKGVDFSSFNEQLEHGTGLTNEQTQAIIDAGDAYDMFAKRIHNAIVTITASIGTEIKLTAQYLDDISNKAEEFGGVFKIVFQTVAVLASDLEFIISGIAAEIEHTINNAKAFWKDGIDGAIRENIRYEKDMRERAERLQEYQNKIMGAGRDPIVLEKPSTAGRATKLGVDKEAEAREKELKRAREKEQAEKDAIEKILNSLKQKQASEQLSYDTKQRIFEIDQAGQYMLQRDVTLAKELFEITAKRRVMVDEIQRTEKISQADKDKLIESENMIADAAERQARARAEIVKFEQTKGLERGFADEMGKFFRDAPKDMENGARAFQSVVGNMDAALSNFVRSGKLSFKDLTRSIIQDLITIQLRAQMISLFRMAFGGGGVGGVTGPDNIDVGGGWSPAMGKAGGGDVSGGMPYYVGERGPELFVPNGNGTIVPNNSLAGAMGGGGQTVNYNGPYIANMSAIDTQSGMQFLAKNKQTIWAANQSAQRSLPMSK